MLEVVLGEMAIAREYSIQASPAPPLFGEQGLFVKIRPLRRAVGCVVWGDSEDLKAGLLFSK